MSKEWCLPICLIALFSTSGWTWGQIGNTLKEEPQKPFLQPYSPETNNQDLNVSSKKIANTGRQKIAGKSFNKARVPAKTLSKSPPGQHNRSEIQNAGQEINPAKSSLNFQRYNHLNSPGSGSFLDGYLLNSLQDKRIERKKIVTDKTSERDSVKKKKEFLK
ncbi:MAG: hypothetical protein C4567_14810 [Deltaproteobacteria bacterium]|nr:MAG: hypothetical protein C4567_14810 [Deltaproteobacteria bacterium]